ncbi:MAG: DoxX family protein [Phycisphaerales bacterium]|jgi:uncharacterized membrane protein YphA (DoxX/SURF4 family)|nr:DoxX family protein [Phycisphaerales bacterium]
MKLSVGGPLVLRLVIGGLLVLSGSMKLGLFKALGIGPLAMDPLDFAFSIKGFQLGLSDTLVQILTYAVPWGELLAGLGMLIGFWTRASAIAVATLMLIFGVGIISLLARDIPVDCPCFGKLKLFCGNQPLGVCHLIRNGVIAGLATVVAIVGPGMAAVDLRGLQGRKA